MESKQKVFKAEITPKYDDTMGFVTALMEKRKKTNQISMAQLQKLISQRKLRSGSTF